MKKESIDRLMTALKTGGVLGGLLFSVLLTPERPLVLLRYAGAIAAGTAAMFALLSLIRPRRSDRGAFGVFLRHIGRILWAGVRWSVILNAVLFVLMMLFDEAPDPDVFPLAVDAVWLILVPIPLCAYLLWRVYCLIVKDPDPDFDDYKSALWCLPRGIGWLIVSVIGLLAEGFDTDSGGSSSVSHHSSRSSGGSSSASHHSSGGSSFGGGHSRGGGSSRHF